MFSLLTRVLSYFPGFHCATTAASRSTPVMARPWSRLTERCVGLINIQYGYLVGVVERVELVCLMVSQAVSNFEAALMPSQTFPDCSC